MGLLDRALNFAKKAYNYVVGNDNKKTAAVNGNPNGNDAAQSKQEKVNPNSVVNPNGELVGTVGDVVVKPSQSAVNPAQKKQNADNNGNNYAVVTQQEIDQKFNELDEKCKKFNIDYREAEENILLNMDFSLKEYKQLNNSEKLRVLNAIDSTLSSYIIDKYKNNEDVDLTSLIGQSAKNLELALNEGGVKNRKEFFQYSKAVNEQLSERLKTAKTEEEKVNIIAEFKKEFRANIESERQLALKGCSSDAEKSKINSRYDIRLEALESQNALEFVAENGPEEAYLSTYFVGGKQYAKTNMNSIRLFKGEARTEAANSYTHQRRLDALKHHHEIGDSISAEEYGCAIQYTTQYMSGNALRQYEADAYNFRVKHQDNLPDYITEEHLTAESAAIGVGITTNVNMTDDEKTDAINTWDTHAQQFNDYDKVISLYNSNLKEYIRNHPEAKQFIERIITKYIKKYGHAPGEKKTTSQNNGNANNKHNAQNRSKIASSSAAAKLQMQRTAMQQQKIAPQQQKATTQQLTNAILTLGFEGAKKAYPHNTDNEFVELIMKDPKLEGEKYSILGYIKTLPVDVLNELTKDCNTDMYLFVLRNISPNRACQLNYLSKNRQCYATRKLSENIIEENQRITGEDQKYAIG